MQRFSCLSLSLLRHFTSTSIKRMPIIVSSSTSSLSSSISSSLSSSSVSSFPFPRFSSSLSSLSSSSPIRGFHSAAISREFVRMYKDTSKPITGKLFVTGIPPGSDVNAIMDIFKKWKDDIGLIYIPRFVTEQSIVTSFIGFSNEASLEAAIGEINNLHVGDKYRIRVEHSRENPMPYANRSLFISSLPPNTDASALQELFARFGVITSPVLIRRSMYMGQETFSTFVNYQTPEVAAEALRNMNQTTFQGQTIRVRFARPSTRVAPRQSYRDETRPPMKPHEPAISS